MASCDTCRSRVASVGPVRLDFAYSTESSALGNSTVPLTKTIAALRAAILLSGLAVFVNSAEAGESIPPMLVSSTIATPYSADPDILTAFAKAMTRYRLTLATLDDPAVPLEPTLLPAEVRARTWLAADGSLLQGFSSKRGFRLITGNCLSLLCAEVECADDGWPVFKCTDGRKRTMVVRDFETVIFDSVTYLRLTGQSAQALDQGAAAATLHCVTCWNRRGSPKTAAGGS